MQKFSVSLLLSLLCFTGSAQQRSLSDVFAMVGVNVMPLSANYGYSACTNYSIQLGSRKFPLKGVLRAGFPQYSPPLSTSHSAIYRLKGTYFMPGIVLYVDDPKGQKNVYYMGLMGYFGSYQHRIDLTVTDTSWNTSGSYHFEGKEIFKGFVYEAGGVFTLYKKLKASASMNTGWVTAKKNPIPQISGFRHTHLFLPGAGRDYSLLIGISVGIHYLIN